MPQSRRVEPTTGSHRAGELAPIIGRCRSWKYPPVDHTETALWLERDPICCDYTEGNRQLHRALDRNQSGTLLAGASTRAEHLVELADSERRLRQPAVDI